MTVSKYDLTWMDSTNTTVEVFGALNTESSGMLSILILVSVFLIVLLVFKQYDTKAVLLANCFITSLIGSFLFFLGWIGYATLAVPVSLMVIMLFINIVWR